MFDTFYIGNKPAELFPFEQQANDIFDAAKQSKTKYCWVIDSQNDYSKFDFHWIPPKWESHQVHVFGSQWQKNSGTYFVPASISKLPKESLVKNYRTEQRVNRKAIIENWIVLDNIDTDDPTSFDFSWHPDPDEPPYIHKFGTVWWNVGGPEYRCPHAIGEKFHDEQRAKTIPNWYNWVIPDHVDKDSFDFSWCPHPDDPPYIYKFGTQWQHTGGPCYKPFMNNGKIKYVETSCIRATSIPKMYNWHLDENTDYSSFDFSWHPDDDQKEYKHVFGTQWQKTSNTFYYSGVEQNPKINYVNDIRVISSNKTLPKYFIETTLEDLINDHPNEKFWALSKELNYDDFDFSWHPDLSQVNYLHVFGTQWQKHGETYLVNAKEWIAGNKQVNYVSDTKSYSSANLSIFYLDEGNIETNVRFEKLKAKYPNIIKTRFANSLQETAKRCATKSITERFWILSSKLNYENFDFSWQPEPWQYSMTHIFGSKWNKWSNTILLSKHDLTQYSGWAKDISEWPNLNFVETIDTLKVETDEQEAEIWYIDHYNKESVSQLETLKKKYPNIKTTKFIDNYLDVINRCVQQSTSSHIWIIASICDYSTFNFGWYPDAWQNDMLHVFASNEQKYGDTFFVPVTEFKRQRKNIQKLEDFNSVNYVSEYSVHRYDIETVIYSEKTLPEALKRYDFSTNYTLFLPEKYSGYNDSICQYTPNLWSGKDRNIHVLSDGAEFALIPKDVVRYMDSDSELYDYPFIDFSKKDWYHSKPQDIVFLSNGEAMAEKMWKHLNDVVKRNGYNNKIHRIDGVNGRANAYKACAEVSETPWFFNVFAKLEVDSDFNFNYQPDRLLSQQHYIFHAKNPVNGLEYGHQAMILYNKELVLNTKIEDTGLDFTLSAKHCVVPILSGVSHYNSDAIVAWRTSFRECIKLKYFSDNADCIAHGRLNTWLNNDGMTDMHQENAEWVIKGANDAIEFYEEVSGELSKLKLSFEWDWLNERYQSKYCGKYSI
jgi:hypothetical protein